MVWERGEAKIVLGIYLPGSRSLDGQVYAEWNSLHLWPLLLSTTSRRHTRSIPPFPIASANIHIWRNIPPWQVHWDETDFVADAASCLCTALLKQLSCIQSNRQGGPRGYQPFWFCQLAWEPRVGYSLGNGLFNVCCHWGGGWGEGLLFYLLLF